MSRKPNYDPSEMIINDDFSYVSPADGKTYTMSAKERLFCENYLSFKGDAVEAVFAAGFNVKNGAVASAMAYDLLRKPNLLAFINSKFEEYGFNDEQVFKQHLFLIQQHGDLKTKAKAIDMFYKLKGTYAPEKTDVRITPDTPLTDDDRALLAILNEHQRNAGTKTVEVDGAPANAVDSETQN